MDDAFQKTIAFYDAYADAFQEKTRHLQKSLWIARFAEHIPPQGIVLDIGCAYGRDAKAFADLGLNVIGIDASRAMIQKARTLVPRGDFRVGDIRTCDLEQGHVDGIWAMAIFIHIPKREMPSLLARLHASLKTGGVLFLGVYLGEGEGMEGDERYQNSEKYYSYFSEDEIKDLLQKTGFCIREFVPRKAEVYERRDVLELLAQKT